MRASASRTARSLSERRPEPPILLLRSFADDEQCVATNDVSLDHALGVARRTIRLNEIVAGIMFARGPLSALANPAVRSRPIGAARDVASHDNWQNLVLEYIHRSDVVVCSFGQTPSFAWETEQLVRLGKLRRLILVFPPDRSDGRSLVRHTPVLASAFGLNSEAEEQDKLVHACALAHPEMSFHGFLVGPD